MENSAIYVRLQDNGNARKLAVISRRIHVKKYDATKNQSLFKTS